MQHKRRETQMTANQINALDTANHGPKGAAAMIATAADDMSAAIRAGDMDAIAKAQASIKFWAESAVFWADAAVRDMQF